MTFFAKIYNLPFVVPSLFISVALVLGLWLVGSGIADRNSDNTISSTGSAEQDATADTAVWVIDLSRTAYAGQTQDAYNTLSSDGTAATTYLSKQDIGSSTVTASVVSTSQNYSSDENAPVTYNVQESITITSNDVQKVNALSHDIGGLDGVLSGGTIASPEAPQYYISNLSDLRVSLLGKAIADAKTRAEQIAKSGGTSVGALESASSGVVQVLAPNSTDVDEEGAYDTSTIEKNVTVTAHVTFAVK